MLYLRLKSLKLVYIEQSAWDPFLNLDNEWNTLTWHDLSHFHSIECLVIRYTCQTLWSKMKVQIFSKSATSTLNCFPLSSGIRWGAHSQYFPIQPFTNSVTLCHNRVTSLNWLWMKSPIAPPAQCTVLDGAQFLSDLQFCKEKSVHYWAHFSRTPHPQGLSTRVSQDGIMKVLPQPQPQPPCNNACTTIIMSP